jgi:hypothetical protein
MAKDVILLGEVAAHRATLRGVPPARVKRLLGRYGADASIRDIMRVQIGSCRTGTIRRSRPDAIPIARRSCGCSARLRRRAERANVPINRTRALVIVAAPPVGAVVVAVNL